MAMLKKMSSLAMAVLLSASVFAGCGTAPTDDSVATGSKVSAAPTTLKIIVPGDRPADLDKLVAAIEEKCPLNVKLNFVFYPHADIQEKTRMSLAANEENDLVWTSGGSNLLNYVNAGYFEKLDDLLAEYGQDIIKMRPQQMWDNTKINDACYTIPLGTYNRFVMHYNVRADLRKKMGYPEITNMDQLIDFAYKAHEAYPEIPTIVPGSFGGEQYCTWATFPFDGFSDTDFVGYTKWNGGSLMLYTKNNDGKMYNLFDTKEPHIWNKILEARKLYKDGIIYSDVLSLKTYRDQMTQNKAVISPWPEIIPEAAYRNQLAANVPGGEIESVVWYQDIANKPGNLVADFSVWNFQSVAANSKNKELAIKFLNWTQQKENYDLCAYGIEGEHCELIGDGQYKNISDKMRQFGYAWIWSPVLDRVDATATEKEFKIDNWARKGDPSDFVNRIDGGLVFDTAKIEKEIAQYGALEAKYYASIFNGVVDPEEYFEKFKKEAYEPLKVIQNELQRQVDEYIAKSKK
ncbi:MAG: extracellular solute-binding protein [Christensenella sp.]